MLSSMISPKRGNRKLFPMTYSLTLIHSKKSILPHPLPSPRILKKIEVDSPVSAIEFHPDGTSLVVGTTRGKLVTYDLRSISTPIQSIVAHTSSVSKLICRLVSLKVILLSC